MKERLPDDCKAEFSTRAARHGHRLRHQGAAHRSARPQALEEEWGRPPALIGMGGSIPIVTSFKDALGMDSLLVGFGLDDDRIHSPNEKYNLTSLPQGRAQLGAHPRQAGGVSASLAVQTSVDSAATVIVLCLCLDSH